MGHGKRLKKKEQKKWTLPAFPWKGKKEIKLESAPFDGPESGEVRLEKAVQAAPAELQQEKKTGLSGKTRRVRSKIYPVKALEKKNFHLPGHLSPKLQLPQRIRNELETKGLRRRWMVNSLSAVLAVAAILVILFTMFYSNYCYSGMRTGLINKIKGPSDFFSSFATDETSYLNMANSYVADFQDRDKLELQFLNARGQVLLSTYGLTSNLTSGIQPKTGDIENVITTLTASYWTGKDPETGERVMSVSSPILHNGEVKGIMRIVSSLRIVDHQIMFADIAALVVAVGVIILVYLVNMYFIKSIITPVTRVTETAKKIAQGSYGAQIEKTYNDEIGDLVDAINHMSSKISQTEKMKSEFISSVSHELRTPLTAINGWSETLLYGEISDEESTKKGLKIIASEGKRLSKMVEELLEFSRIEDGRFTLNMSLVDIQAEFEDAIFTYRQFYRKTGIKLEYQDTVDLLDPIPGDPERLKQVFSNVLDNAAKHGGSDQVVQSSLSVEGDKVVIRVRDHGPGISEKDLPHVKEMFYKASSKARGSGIGLSVCDEIVTRHGGTLDINNAEGGGCVVTISLPMSRPISN